MIGGIKWDFMHSWVKCFSASWLTLSTLSEVKDGALESAFDHCRSRGFPFGSCLRAGEVLKVKVRPRSVGPFGGQNTPQHFSGSTLSSNATVGSTNPCQS